MSVVPTGTVTFLFTDIEGSTRRWDQQSEAMKIALARHDTILRSGIEAHGGHVFKTVGDGFYAAFATAPDALAAALKAQRALAAESWGEVGELRVRMALHTGAVQHRDGDYFGQAPNRVSRLLNTGHGGQTLLSLATQELVRDQLPEGVQLRDLGSHRLRDLIRPEEIFQVVAPPLQAEFPPLKTLDARPHNLQTQPTPLIGREREVGQVCTQLRRDSVRLLTLTGPGGTGKTRLALQVAADLLDDYKDGVYFVALAPLSDPTLVVSTIAQALGVKESSGRSILQCLQDCLREKTFLLALDNFEQVTAAAPQVAELLANCPTLNVLVTSRIPLHVRGEHEFPVPPLALPNIKHLPALDVLSQYAAVELFIQRAQAVKPDFAVNNDNAPAVAEICVRLDGLPLAIELAAARIKLLAPRAMLRRLEDPLKLLIGGAGDLSARQQTLRGAIAWSYDLLDDNEKRLFRRLAIFVGGCTLEAAEAVCNAVGNLGVDVFDGIASLVDKSLLRQQDAPDGEPRVTMLETIREFGLERLAETPDHEAVQRLHADHFLALAQKAAPRLHSEDATTWLDRFEAEHDNLRAALNWLKQNDAEPALRIAIAMSEMWAFRGYWMECREALERVLASGGNASAESRIKAMRCAARCAFDQSEIAKCTRLLEDALTLSHESGNRRGTAETLRDMATKCEVNYTQRDTWLGESLAIFRELQDETDIAQTLYDWGLSHHSTRDVEQASAKFGEALQRFQAINDKAKVADCLIELGLIATIRRDFAQARSCLNESLVRLRRIGDKSKIAVALYLSGNLAGHCYDYPLAHSLCEESVQLLRAIGNKSLLADSLSEFGDVATQQGDYAQARAAFEECMQISRDLGAKHTISNTLRVLGCVAQMEGKHEEAISWVTRGLDTARELGDDTQIALSLRELGFLALQIGYDVKARALFEEGLQMERTLASKGYHDLIVRRFMDGFAWLAIRKKEPAEAARLLAAVDQEPTRILIFKSEHERQIAAARSALSEEAFSAAWAEGRAMTREQAVAYVLGELEVS